MASMIFASSPLSAQSFVKLRTNSNYSHSPCYVSRAKNSYIHLPYKNISNIQSSKSLFTKVDGNFSFLSTKFPRVASKYSPSLNIIKAISRGENVYDLNAHDVKTGKNIQLGDRYKGQILLIVNLPQEFSSENAKKEIKFLNDLRTEYKNKTSRGFEILGLFPYTEEKDAEEKIKNIAEFPIFRKGGPPDFEKYLVDKTGKCRDRLPWFEGETLKSSKKPTPPPPPPPPSTPEGNPQSSNKEKTNVQNGVEEGGPQDFKKYPAAETGKCIKGSEKPRPTEGGGDPYGSNQGETNIRYNLENAIIKLLEEGDDTKHKQFTPS